MLSANSTQFTRDIDRAEKRWKQFGGALSSPIAGFGRGLNLPMAAVQGFLGPIQQLATSVPFVGASLASLAGGGGFASLLQTQAGKIKDTAVEAQKLGVSFADLASIKLAAGPAAEAAVPALARLERSLGQVALGSEVAEKNYRLLGLDAEKLTKLPLTESLGQVADKLNAMPRGEKMALGYAIFGRQFHEIVPLIDKGSEGLTKAAEKAKEWGLALDAGDVAKVRNMGLAFREIELRIEGVKNQWTVAWAPGITAATKGLTGQMGLLDQLGKKSGQWFQDFQVGLAHIGDTIEQKLGMQAASEWGRGQHAQAKHDQLVELNDPVVQKEKAAADAEMSRNLARSESIYELNTKLRGLIDTHGLGGQALDIWKLKMKGATEEDLASVMAKKAALEALEDLLEGIQGMVTVGTIFDQNKAKVNALASAYNEGRLGFEEYTEVLRKLHKELEKKVDTSAAKAFDDARTPLEKFNERLREMQQLSAAGKISAQTFARTAGKDFQALAGHLAALEARSPTALTRGSQQAESAIIKAQLGDRRGAEDPQKRVERHMAMLVEIEQGVLKHTEETANALKNMKVIDF